MELILISETKLKVMLSAEDMQRYNLTCDTIDCENTRSRRAFWSILDEAKQQTGFDPAGDKVFVQLYPSKSGGCEMFVTKLGLRVKQKEMARADLSEEGVIDALPAAELSEEAQESAYSFETMNDMLLACRRMREGSEITGGRAYVEERKHGYFLVLPVQVSYLSEYNAQLCMPYETAYIYEHCRCFCTDAVHLLGALA